MAALRITNSLSPLRWSVGKPETAGEPLAQPQLHVPHGSSRTAGRSSPIFPRTRSCLLDASAGCSGISHSLEQADAGLWVLWAPRRELPPS